MTTFRRITKRDGPTQVAATAALHEALLSEALEIAKRKAEDKPPLVCEILSTGAIEGLAQNLNSKVAAVSYRAEKFSRTWHTLIPWQYLENSSPEAEAESMIETVEANIQMTEGNSWTPLPTARSKRKKPE